MAILLGIALIFLQCCGKRKQLSQEAQACIYKFDERIEFLEEQRRALTNSMADSVGLLKVALTNNSGEIAQTLSKEFSKTSEELRAVEREKWETELRRLRFILNYKEGIVEPGPR